MLSLVLPLIALAACQHVEAGGEAAAAAAACPEGAVGTQMQLATAQEDIAYRACAGTLAVADEKGAKEADLFYTAYLAPGSQQRPIAFIWNGGPGSDSRLLQFHALGPKTLHGTELADNPESPIASADLIFLDPAGTGFSRAASDEAARRLYSTTGDIAATAQFIRKFLKAEGRSSSPVYLVGESFGTWRAAGVAEALVDTGQPVAGIALISGGIPRGEEHDRALMRAFTLPNRTATALALGKLNARLSSHPEATLEVAEDWARKAWYPALADPEALDDEARAEIVAGLSLYMGISPDQIDAKTLWVSPRDFRKSLLADQGKTLGIFDMRRTDDEEDVQAGADAIIGWYRHTLGYTRGQYAGIDVPALPVGRNWQYDQAPITKASLARAMAGEGPPSPSRPWVLHALTKDPTMRVFVATGLYDSLNGCFSNRAAAQDFPPALAARIATHCYRGGHMMYEVPEVGRQFAEDLSSFFGNSRDSRNRE
ncbi:S10 family serine carboxypeptidase-like protein [Novosphingobium malaysiense]|uniref:S10 family serine carboxypeptidase-like protein n=1 Tax=Novosphingobium malaysiense TaxID=1348853 RepID=UPI001E2CA04B|nr:peptidase S10 [Novosphingobium malaysiense]